MAEKKKDDSPVFEPPKDATPAQVREFEVWKASLEASDTK